MTRISQRSFPNYTRKNNPDYNGEAWMLTRDIELGIVPYRSSKGAEFNVRLTEADTEAEMRLCKLLKVHHEEFNLTDAYITFVHDITPYLTKYGELYFEISGDGQKEELDIIPLGPMLHISKKYYQIVPFEDWKGNDRKIIPISDKHVWHLKLPLLLGSPKAHRRLLGKIQTLSEPVPKFFFDDGVLGKSVGYDFMYHRKLKELARENLTRKWGSIPSLGQLSGTTEYYYIVHSLRFKCAQALIREHITSELNSILLRKVGLDNSIEVVGLPSSESILQALKKLEDGEIDFAEALDAAKTP